MNDSGKVDLKLYYGLEISRLELDPEVVGRLADALSSITERAVDRLSTVDRSLSGISMRALDEAKHSSEPSTTVLETKHLPVPVRTHD